MSHRSQQRAILRITISLEQKYTNQKCPEEETRSARSRGDPKMKLPLYSPPGVEHAILLAQQLAEYCWLRTLPEAWCPEVVLGSLQGMIDWIIAHRATLRTVDSVLAPLPPQRSGWGQLAQSLCLVTELLFQRCQYPALPVTSLV